MPDLSPGHAVDWDLRQLQLKVPLRGLAVVPTQAVIASSHASAGSHAACRESHGQCRAGVGYDIGHADQTGRFRLIGFESLQLVSGVTPLGVISRHYGLCVNSLP